MTNHSTPSLASGKDFTGNALTQTPLQLVQPIIISSDSTSAAEMFTLSQLFGDCVAKGTR